MPQSRQARATAATRLLKGSKFTVLERRTVQAWTTDLSDKSLSLSRHSVHFM